MPPFRPSKSADAQMSRIADVVIAVVLLAFTLPLMIIISIAIRADSLGPVLERESCIGRRGRRFQLLQFRTRELALEETRPGWAKPEVTRVGALLRYTRIESLPQLFNVLLGDMSIIEMDGRSPSFLE